jgi:hypothetical protein
MNNVTYFIDKENGIVVCTGKECEYDALKKIVKIYNSELIYEYLNDPRFRTLLMPKTFKGVAKLHPSDKDNFNETIGKDIAHDKMVKKYMNSKKKAILRFVNEIEKDIRKANMYVNGITDKYDLD